MPLLSILVMNPPSLNIVSFKVQTILFVLFPYWFSSRSSDSSFTFRYRWFLKHNVLWAQPTLGHNHILERASELISDALILLLFTRSCLTYSCITVVRLATDLVYIHRTWHVDLWLGLSCAEGATYSLDWSALVLMMITYLIRVCEWIHHHGKAITGAVSILWVVTCWE